MLTVGVLLMVAAGMYRTGAITVITEKLIGRPKSLMAAQRKILPPVAIGSAFLNNTPLVAMFIPVIRDLARTCRLAATRLYIPLSYSSILGGTCTLIGTSTNLVVAGMVTDYLAKAGPHMPHLRTIGMFDLAWIGLPASIVGIVFLMLTSRFLLPVPKESHDKDEIKRIYGAEFKVIPDSQLIGKSLGELGYVNPVGFKLLELRCKDGSKKKIEKKTLLKADDLLSFSTDLQTIPSIWDTNGLEPAFGPFGHEPGSERFTHRLVQAIPSRRCSVLGRNISEFPVNDSPYKISPIAMSRKGKPVPGALSNARIEAGDNLVLEVDERFFHENLNEVEFSMVHRLTGARFKRYDRAVIATLITIAMVAVVALNRMTMLNAALLAAGAMLLTGCLGLKDAGRSIDFKTLIIIASAIGLEASVTGSGLSAKIAHLLASIGGDNPYIALTVVFTGCIAMNTMVTNVASAVFMFPIAMAMAGHLGVNGMPFAITVMLGASSSFISPMGYQTNLMVYGPGGYKFTDYVKIGVPLTILVGFITVILTPLIFKF
jgi:di/tricarboxylate transporter